ncbi:MAG: carbohydrate ABC transporter permease [Lachnospiraceae bacterium]|nr:carbohydrate ABC transporter permease [Lachnospiraceae bacterium]
MKKKIIDIGKIVLLSVMLMLYMVPFFLIIINSLKRKITIIKHPLKLIDPKGLFTENYISAFKEMNYLNAFENSFFITVLSVVFIILFSSMAAYYMARNKTKASKISFSLIVAAMVIPFQAIMIPLISIYGNMLGLLNHRLTLIFMNVGFGMGLAIFIYYGFIISGIPLSLEEAAIIDGCSPYQVFFKIVFPLLKPTTATMIVLDVLWLWNDYLLPSLILGKKVLFTLPLSTFSFYGTYSNDLGKIMAGLVLTVLPVIVIYLLLQKQIISGVVAGAVKS